jgi:alanyl-tRNA synthetase
MRMTSPTVRLSYADSIGLDFAARVVAHDHWGERPSVVLDTTGFYPESGGQMADHGALHAPNGAVVEVDDVQVDDAGRVHHLLTPGEPPLEVGSVVEGHIDRARRRAFCALHTGQHMLSRALIEVAGAETLSSRLGEGTCTIDTPNEVLRERDLAQAEALVNALVDDDVAVRAFFPDAETLAALPLRRAPKVTDDVRVVAIGDFDVSPCGGTHCTRTAQVGLLRIEGVERYKGGQRVTFSAGPRARAALFALDTEVRALARALTCGPSELAAAFDRVRNDLSAARVERDTLRERLLALWAPALYAARDGRGWVVAALPGEDANALRGVARHLVRLGAPVVLLAAPTADGTAVLAARGAESSFDCGGFIKRVASAHGGRGGGRPEGAEGRLPGAVTDWNAAVVAALS